MKIPKPTQGDKDWFRSVVEDLPGSEVKAMFGNLAAFVNGNMYCGLFGPDLGVRLSEGDRAELEAIEGSGPFGPPDRPMKEYVTVPRAWRDGDPETLDAWVHRALDHTSTLPPKKPKKKTAKK